MQWHRWFPGDYIRDTGALSLTEHGAYRVLLDHYYSTDGKLKADMVALFRICRAMTEDEQAAVGRVVKEFFTPDESGFLKNPRADKEIAEAADYHAMAKERAKHAAEQRWKDAKSNATSMLKECLSDAIPQPQPHKEKTKAIVGANAPDGFLNFWKSWPPSPRKGGKSECLRRWLAKGLEDSAPAILAHVEAMKSGKQWADANFIPAPLTYLNQSRWDGAEATPADDPYKGVTW